MRAVVSDILWIGNAIEARDISSVLQRGIEAVIDLAIEEKPIAFPRDIAYFRVPLLDGQGNAHELLQIAVDLTIRLVAAKRTTLICCGAGMSRSPSIAAKAISRLRGVPAEETLLEITSHGPHDVSPLFWAELCKAITG